MVLNLANQFIEEIDRNMVDGRAVIEEMMICPKFRRQPYQSVTVRQEARYLGDNKIGLRYNNTPSIQKLRKKLSDENIGDPPPTYYPAFRLLVVPVNRDTLRPLQTMIAAGEFDFDESVTEFLALSVNSIGSPSEVASNHQTIVARALDDELLGWSLEHLLGAEII